MEDLLAGQLEVLLESVLEGLLDGLWELEGGFVGDSRRSYEAL